MKKMLKGILFSAAVVLGVFLAVPVQAADQMKGTGADLLPPDAKPGECYARVFIPPTYKTVTEQVLAQESGQNLKSVEPVFETVEEKVMVKGPTQRVESIPAKYGWVEERVLVQPEYKQLRSVPPVYKTVSEEVMISPARTEWKKGTGPIQKVDNATGEIMCLVTVPATYKTVTRSVLEKKAATEEVIIPAKYETVRKEVMKEPPTTRVIEIPAEYKMVKVRKLVTAAGVTASPIPEKFQTISRVEMVTDGRMEWKSILCETNAKPGVISSLQKSLKTAGHDPGPIDGKLGRGTMTAVMSYQKAKGLPTGQLTTETMNSLGVKY
jgi:hypothetical protein